MTLSESIKCLEDKFSWRPQNLESETYILKCNPCSIFKPKDWSKKGFIKNPQKLCCHPRTLHYLLYSPEAVYSSTAHTNHWVLTAFFKPLTKHKALFFFCLWHLVIQQNSSALLWQDFMISWSLLFISFDFVNWLSLHLNNILSCICAWMAIWMTYLF